MSEAFGAAYAEAYDALYADKDYAGECDLLERLFREHADGEVRSVLDLGAGTGGHALTLAGRGYDVVGVELSPAMAALARAKAGADGPRFREADLRTVRLRETFDAVLMMFAVLGYQAGEGDAEAALRTAREHLRPGGLLVFDVWHEPAVRAERPGSRTKRVGLDGGLVERTSHGRLDEATGVCTVDFRLRIERRGQEPLDVRETHLVRPFGRDELDRLATATGFELVFFRAFPDVEREPDETTWNVVAAARAA